MAKTFGFSAKGTRRIVRTVRRIEGLPVDLAPGPRRQRQLPSRDLLVKITGVYSSGFPWAAIDGSFAVITGGPDSDTTGRKAVHIWGATSLPVGERGTLRIASAGGTPVLLFMPERSAFPAIVTASSGTAPGATYTVKWADLSGAGYGNYAAQSGAPSLTAYNDWEEVDREAAGTINLNPTGDATDEATIKNIPNDEPVMLRWNPHSGGGGSWRFTAPCDYLTECDV